MHQIEGGRGSAQRRQDRMRLSTMMRLMIEQMGKGRRDALADRAHVADRRIGEAPGDVAAIKSIDPVNQAGILLHPRGLQCIVFLEQDGIKCPRCFAIAGEAIEPDAVGYEQVVERSVHGFEEGTRVAPVGFFIEGRRRFIQPCIRPAIIGREHAKMLLHQIDFLPK